MKRKLSLSGKILLVLNPMIFLCMALIGFIACSQLHSVLAKELSDQLLRATRDAASNIDTWVEGRLLEVEANAESPAARRINRGFEEIDELNELRLDHFLSRHENEFGMLSASNKEGLTHDYIAENGRIVIKECDISVFQDFKDMKSLRKRTIITDPIESMTTNEILVYVLASIIGEKGEFLGLSSAGITMGYIADEIGGLKYGETGYALAVDRNGTVIACPKTELILKENLLELKGSTSVELGKRMISGETGIFDHDYMGIEKFAFYAPVNSAGWSVALVVDKEEFFNPIVTLRNKLILVTVIISLVLSGIVNLVVALLIRPMNRVSRRITEISEGKGDLTDRLKVRDSGDEISQLAFGFNRFVGRLHGIVVSIKNSSSDNVAIKHDLAGNIEETVSAVTQVNTNLSGVNSMVRSLDSRICDSAAAVDQISVSIEELDSSIQNQAGAVHESSSSVTEMVRSLANVSEIVKKKRASAMVIVETARESCTAVQGSKKLFQEGIADKIDKISEMTLVIQRLASQTNLLSMNAAIEAAHAGESGKGFAVVADEIRKLAEESTANSRDISQTIKEIVQSIHASGENVEKTVSTFSIMEKGIIEVDTALGEIQDASAELSAGGTQILNAMTQLNETTRVVKDRSVEIRKSSALVRDNLNEVATISSEVTNAASEAACGTGEIQVAMGKSQELMVAMGDAIDQVNSEICLFVTEKV